MKGTLISSLFLGAAVAAVSPVLSTIYADAYPGDPIKRQALAQCYQADHGFNRLLADERAACYQRFAPVAPPALPLARAAEPQIAVNFVDLWQAQARGRQPAHDLRIQQQNSAALRLIRAQQN
jgi:hypothetical protein